jgi:predicted permease
MLLTGAGLITRSFARLVGTDAGFNPKGVLTFKTSAPAGTIADSARYAAFFAPVLERIRAIPRVRSAGFTDLLPIQDGTTDSFIAIIGHPVETDPLRRPDAQIRYVSRDYFRTLRIPLVAGRELDETDTPASPRVMLVNEELVLRFLPGENPLGKQIDPGNGQPATIVGVVKSVRQVGLDRPPQPELYLAGSQMPAQLGALTFVVATDGDPRLLAPAVRNAVRDVASTQPVYQMGTMEAVMTESLKVRRLVLVLLGGFAALALGLSAAGVYGVMSYGVSQRTREIGIRMALGARRHEVTSMILGDVVRVLALGVVIGIGGAGLVTRVLQSVLFGVGARDPITFVVAPAVIAGVAMLAGAIPALRASRVDPLVAMRSD